MRLLADENFPRLAVEALRQAGHDVAWVPDSASSIPDDEVLAWAAREERTVLTQDKGFGERAFGAGLPSGCGVVLFRVLPVPDFVADIAVRLFEPGTDFRGRFLVVEETRVRERPLPS